MGRLKLIGPFLCSSLTNHSPFTADSDSKLREQIRRAEIDEASKNYNHLSLEGKGPVELYEIPRPQNVTLSFTHQLKIV